MLNIEIFNTKWNLLIQAIKLYSSSEAVYNGNYCVSTYKMAVSENEYILRCGTMKKNYQYDKLKFIMTEDNYTGEKEYITAQAQLCKNEIMHYVLYGWDGYYDLQCLKKEIQDLKTKINLLHESSCEENSEEVQLYLYDVDISELYQILNMSNRAYNAKFAEKKFVHWLRKYFLSNTPIEKLIIKNEGSILNVGV